MSGDRCPWSRSPAGTALTCAEMIVTVSQAETDVTERRSSAYHRLVRYRTEQLLTKRRAVDFCRVTTALCRMA
ncbi:hypothetical protein Acsp04_48970 [Actinomadura sp. NBRC 104425]|uniref:putative leader peptide n=1 Tax=Actinomadura sp. NBRC 104425 TaxID=3032204 RepID=UPI0024A1912F|nr:putative leader peptide [Actinomadura sp. NBRC 104425]GLZ14662.1 hypothetical protein Acsp04_48970 [Actinomadura sp. NBRC 104425]